MSIFDIAESIVTALNAETFSESFTAELNVLPRFERSETEDLIVTVLPASEDYENETRDSYSIDTTIEIGVQAKINAKSADVKKYAGLTKEIADFLFMKNFNNASFRSISRDPVYDIAGLSDQRVFLSVITVTHKSWHYPAEGF